MVSAMAPSFAKRKSLRDHLNHFRTLDDDSRSRERRELLEKLEKDVEDAKRFRCPKCQDDETISDEQRVREY